MFFLRPVELGDLDQILDLSQLQTFINLPSNSKALKNKIKISNRTFQQPSTKLEENYYLFAIIDSQTQHVIGVSMIHGKHGTQKEPHFSYALELKKSLAKPSILVLVTVLFNLISKPMVIPRSVA